MFSILAFSALLLSTLVSADPVPSAPGPGDVFREGGQCTFAWTPDTSGVWKVMNVELMTGSNLAMIHLTTVATLDGTSATTTTYSYPCPQVTPNSAIYFYQFTSPASSNRTWTTRFAIADATGRTTPPPQATQPGSGAPIPWGNGALVHPGDARPAPPNGGGSGPATNTSSTATSTSSRPSAPAASVSTRTSSSSSSSAPSAATSSAAGASNGAAGLGAEARAHTVKAFMALSGMAVALVLLL